MTCKAQKALRAECSLECEGHWYDCNVTKAQDAALAFDDCIPREVAEQVREALKDAETILLTINFTSESLPLRLLEKVRDAMAALDKALRESE